MSKVKAVAEAGAAAVFGAFALGSAVLGFQALDASGYNSFFEAIRNNVENVGTYTLATTVLSVVSGMFAMSAADEMDRY